MKRSLTILIAATSLLLFGGTNETLTELCRLSLVHPFSPVIWEECETKMGSMLSEPATITAYDADPGLFGV